MKKRLITLLCATSLFATSFAANDLPDLGESSRAVLTPQMEREIGQSIMNEIRLREPSYIDDAYVNDYLAALGRRLVSASDSPTGQFHFFAISDPTINAFAMFGGFIGVNSGLLLQAQSESELAGVVSHEIAHVTQSHLARHMAKEKQNTVPALIALAVGILAARSNASVAAATITSAQAGFVQAQLAYSRDFEREADRVGYQTLERAQLDVRGMGDFFERLQKAGRLYDMGAPVYLRSHPLTLERITDMQNRAQSAPYRQVQSSLDFYLVRARLKALFGNATDAVRDFETQIKEEKSPMPMAAQYGLALALDRANRKEEAGVAVEKLRQMMREQKASSAMLSGLDAKMRLAAGDKAQAFLVFRAGISRFPEANALKYAYAAALLEANQYAEAKKFLQNQLQNKTSDPLLYEALAKTHAKEGNHVEQMRAQAEFYYLQGQTGAAIEQLTQAQNSKAGDFYTQSAIDARLRTFKQQQLEERQNR